MLNYYNFDKPTLENKNFYFANEGIFNFWGECLFAHINGYNIVLADRLGKEYHGSITDSENALVKSRIKNGFCNAKSCSTSSGATSCCEIITDWGKDVCKHIGEWINI